MHHHTTRWRRHDIIDALEPGSPPKAGFPASYVIINWHSCVVYRYVCVQSTASLMCVACVCMQIYFVYGSVERVAKPS